MIPLYSLKLYVSQEPVASLRLPEAGCVDDCTSSAWGCWLLLLEPRYTPAEAARVVVVVVVDLVVATCCLVVTEVWVVVVMHWKAANRAMVEKVGIKLQISYITIKNFINWTNWNPQYIVIKCCNVNKSYIKCKLCWSGPCVAWITKPNYSSKPNTSNIRKPNSTRIIIPSTSRPTYIYIYIC